MTLAETHLMVLIKCPVSTLYQVELRVVEFGEIHSIPSSICFTKKTAPMYNKNTHNTVYMYMPTFLFDVETSNIVELEILAGFKLGGWAPNCHCKNLADLIWQL